MSNVEQWEHDEQRAMENEIISLREQVEKLTKERDAEIARNRPLQSLIALAEQNELLTRALNYCVSQIVEFEDVPGVAEALRLPDIASPVINRIRADGMRMASEICDSPMDRAAAQKICAKADELGQSNG